MRLLLILLTAIGVFGPCSDLRARTWTHRDGRQIEAELTAYRAGIVTLRRSKDGKLGQGPLTLLSTADQDYVLQRAARSNATRGEAVTFVQAESSPEWYQRAARLAAMQQRQQAYDVVDAAIAEATADLNRFLAQEIPAIPHRPHRDLLVERDIIAYVDRHYAPVFFRALTLAARWSREISDRRELGILGQRSATWALNLKGVASTLR